MHLWMAICLLNWRNIQQGILSPTPLQLLPPCERLDLNQTIPHDSSSTLPCARLFEENQNSHREGTAAHVQVTRRSLSAVEPQPGLSSSVPAGSLPPPTPPPSERGGTASRSSLPSDGIRPKPPGRPSHSRPYHRRGGNPRRCGKAPQSPPRRPSRCPGRRASFPSTLPSASRRVEHHPLRCAKTAAPAGRCNPCEGPPCARRGGGSSLDRTRRGAAVGRPGARRDGRRGPHRRGFSPPQRVCGALSPRPRQ
mmetsp:Transcript_10896/g.32271  ORF Transcript_10896/g.32271 Transcript_10896/m.32271 type:complete len:252 (+) Transcript_10896:1379-2134(+)